MSEQNRSVEKVSNVASGIGIFSTIDDSTREGKLKTFAAMSDAKPLNEHLDEPILLANVIMRAVEVKDAKTEEVNDAVRTLLIDSEGQAYAATSEGIVGSLIDLFAIVGKPDDWPEPIPVKVIEQRGRNGFRFMKIVLA